MKILKDNIQLIIAWTGIGSFIVAGFLWGQLFGFRLGLLVGFHYVATICFFIAWNESRNTPPEEPVISRWPDTEF